MSIKSFVLSCAFVVASAVTGSAATYNVGDATNGLTTSQTLATKSVDYINFTLDAPPGYAVTAFTITVTSMPGSNFREMIGLYSGNQLVATADSGVGRGGSGATLSFSGATVLAEGSYTLAIGGWKSFFTTDIANARSTASFRNGEYSVTIVSTIAAVPLPAGGLLLLSGLGGIFLMRRKAA